MSVEVLFSLLGLALFLYTFFWFSSSTPPSRTPQAASSKAKEDTIKNLSSRASALRRSLGVAQKRLDECTPLSIMISVDNVFMERISEGGEFKFVVDPEIVLCALSLVCEFADVRLIVPASTDEEEEQVRQLLQGELIGKSSSFSRPILPHRILFHSTEVGKTAIVRQVLPDIHIDADASLCEAMCPFVENVVQVARPSTSQDAPAHSGAWRVVQSWEQLWALPSSVTQTQTAL